MSGCQVAGKYLARVTTGLLIAGNVTVITGGKAVVTGKNAPNMSTTNTVTEQNSRWQPVGIALAACRVCYNHGNLVFSIRPLGRP